MHPERKLFNKLGGNGRKICARICDDESLDQYGLCGLGRVGLCVRLHNLDVGFLWGTTGKGLTENSFSVDFFQQYFLGGYGNAPAITTVKEKVVTKGASPFLLNFDDSDWSFEDAVPAIFLSDCDPAQCRRLSPDMISFLLNEGGGNALAAELGKKRVELIDALHSYLMNVIFRPSLPDRKKAHPPIIWCRIATQFWLINGGRQESFMSAMTNWIRKKNKWGTAYVRGRSQSGGKSSRMPLEAFLFGGSELPDLITTDWAYKHRSGTHNQKPKAKSKLAGNRSDEDQVGSHLLPAVQNAVQKLSNDPNGRKLFLHKPDPKTGKFRYKGLRDELYDAIYEMSSDISSKRQLKNGQYQKPYAKGSVKKAISKVAICRRAWPRNLAE